ncbi:DUF996 domain-containing protein [Pyrobaculum aerophilum]|uniref:DUF996 domain-containing protein n=1 Tax=Pyrobaculum aerophilum TaxID=13773 RepID=A0A371R385_9CREN|nr:DUF996 domain-containing protein [Pyrobaculum aerophilum]RFA98265.1 hypothetical protein CGL51_00850 [Pyrobaculum aerophilum]RFA99294.1 hypothetical protein CGL52_03695 [Pyrobaculum aerophilum]
MDIDAAKVLGGLGAFLAAIGFFAGWPASVVGVVLLYVALAELRIGVGEDRSKWLVYAISALVAFGIAQAILGFSLERLRTWWELPARGLTLAVGLAAWAAGWVLQVASAYRLRHILAALQSRTGESLFSIANTLYWWGSALAVVAIGLIIVAVAYILMGVGLIVAKTQ